MSIKLNTGETYEPYRGVSSFDGEVVDNSPSERVIYPSERDQFIQVSPNSMVVVTAYTTSCDPIEVSKVLMSNGIPDSAAGTGCCLFVRKGASSAVINQVVVRAYTLTNDNPVRVLTIPGMYRVVPTSDEEGDITITAVEYPIQTEGPSVPEVFGVCADV